MKATGAACSCWPPLKRHTTMPTVKESLAAAQQLLEEKLANNASAVAHEYERIRSQLPRPRKLQDWHQAATHPENVSKNRYRDVLPYDKTRVCLKASGNDPNARPTDLTHKQWAGYINASHLQSGEGGSSRADQHWPNWEYIGAQGPLPQTVADFWELAYEQNCTVILMLTNHVEGNVRKCEGYLPTKVDEPKQYGVFTVMVKSVVDFCEDIQLREVTLQRCNDPETPRKILHFHYHKWPDHGCPRTTEPLRRLARAVAAHTQETSCGPPLVHCSAGIGRTGTFCTVDIALRRLQALESTNVTLTAAKQAVDIKQIVQKLRRQRQGMVQTKSQYIFCHEAVLAEVMDMLHKFKEDK